MKDDTKTKKIEEKEELLESSTEKEDKLLQELKQKNEELENKYKRALADYQNLEKRSLEERRNWIVTSNRELLLRILPVLDTLLLVLEHSKDPGIIISVNQFLDLLKQEGVEKIETVGKTFDPQLMECIETVEGKDAVVLKETRIGYILNGRVLRVAQVVVGEERLVN